MLKIGLTGGIGSGKTTVANIFMHLGVPVFFADDEAKNIANTSAVVREQLIKAFGAEAYTENSLNKAFFTKLIFTNEDARKQMNAIIHPAVVAHFEIWASQQNAPYVLQEAAILFETGGYKRFHKNILVYAPQELRIQRVMQRNGISRTEVLARMANQGSPNDYRKLADFIIENDEQQLLLPQVMQVHKALLAC